MALAALMTFVVGPASAGSTIALPVLANHPFGGGGFFGGGFLAGGLCGGFWVIWFIIWILVGIWVYRDAEKRGTSGVLWLIVVILLGIIGLIIYLILRPGGLQSPPG
jgi:hypothetical protein